MLLVPGWMALVLLLPAAGPEPGAEAISTKIQCLEMEGLGWREAFHGRLEPVAQQGVVTVWTGDRLMAHGLRSAAKSVLAAPMVVSQTGERAVVEAAKRQGFVASLKRVADGPLGQATAVAFLPGMGAVEDGLRIQVTGRPMDQGVLAQVAIAESQVIGMHHVKVKDAVQGKTPEEGERALAAVYQVPELACSRIAGEWLIPKAGVLVLSLGARSVQGTEGKAIQERLIVIEAEPRTLSAAGIAAPTPSGLASLLDAVPQPTLGLAPGVAMPGAGAAIAAVPGMMAPERILFVAAAPRERLAVAQHMPLPEPGREMAAGEPVPLRVAAEPRPEGLASVPGTVAAAPAHPRLPSRALPEAYNAEGEPVELPPLPHDPPVTEDPSGQPVGTPQARPLPDSPPAPKPSSLALGNGASGKVTVELKGVTITTPQGQVEAEQLTLQMDLPRGLKLDTTRPGSLVVQAVEDPESHVVEWVPARAPAARQAVPLPPIVPVIASQPAACPERCPESATCAERGELPECPFAATAAPAVDPQVNAAAHSGSDEAPEVAVPYRLRLPIGRGALEFRVRVSKQRVPLGGD